MYAFLGPRVQILNGIWIISAVFVVLAHYFEGLLFQRSTIPKVRVRVMIRVSMARTRGP